MGLIDFSWQVDEPAYRKGSGLSYSTLATKDRGGLSELEFIIKGGRKSSSALTFGSMVDTLITEEDTFFDRFCVSKVKKYPSEKIMEIVMDIYQSYKNADVFGRSELSSLLSMDELRIIEACDRAEYYMKYPNKSRVSYILKDGEAFYQELMASDGLTLVCRDDYNDALTVVNTLRSSKYFKELFYNKESLAAKGIEMHFQLKFKLEGRYNVRCMFDMIKIDHVNKKIFPIDLKTTGYPESHFRDSFFKWRYNLQSSLYSYILRESIKSTPYHDYTIEPFRFLVINRRTLAPTMFIDAKSTSEDAVYLLDGEPLDNWKKVYEDVEYAIEKDEFKYERETSRNEGVVILNN